MVIDLSPGHGGRDPESDPEQVRSEAAAVVEVPPLPKQDQEDLVGDVLDIGVADPQSQKRSTNVVQLGAIGLEHTLRRRDVRGLGAGVARKRRPFDRVLFRTAVCST